MLHFLLPAGFASCRSLRPGPPLTSPSINSTPPASNALIHLLSVESLGSEPRASKCCTVSAAVPDLAARVSRDQSSRALAARS